jgi:hypothetical protein
MNEEKQKTVVILVGARGIDKINKKYRLKLNK